MIDGMTMWGRFYAEARRIARSRGTTKDAEITAIAYDLRHKAFLYAIEPYLRKKAKLVACRVSKLLFRPGAPPSVQYESDPEFDRAIDMLDQLIAYEAERYGVDYEHA
jgi:hypothetical protein